MDNVQQGWNKGVLTYASVILILVVLVTAFYFFASGRGLPGGSVASATSSATIVISNCDDISPATVNVPYGGTVTFDNSDSVAHVLYLAGKTANVSPGGSANMALDFGYGTGIYGYSCDGKLTSDSISIIASSPAQPMSVNTFKDTYDRSSASVQSCLKAALGSEFDKTYADSSYVPATSTTAGVDSCFAQ